MTAATLMLANGSSLCGLIAQARLPGVRVVPQLDLLSHGPVRGYKADDAWRQARETFWRDFFAVWPGYDVPGDDYAALAPYRDGLGDLDIVLWAGASIDEQLSFLASAVALPALGADPRRVFCVTVDHDPARGTALTNPGRLSEAGLAALQARRAALTPAHWQVLEASWQALVAEDPRALREYGARPAREPLALLQARVGALQSARYPRIETGLNQLQERVLCACRDHGPRVTRAIPAMIDSAREDIDAYHDNVVLVELHALGAGEKPLVTLDGSLGSPALQVSLTARGRAVLAAQQRWRGAERWIGGVKLPPASPWVYDPHAGCVREADV